MFLEWSLPILGIIKAAHAAGQPENEKEHNHV